MKRKLLLLISLTALNMLLTLSFSPWIIQKNKMESKVENISDNTLLVSLSQDVYFQEAEETGISLLGYTAEYIQNVEKIKGVSTANFIDDSNFNEYYEFTTIDSKINGAEIQDYYGNYNVVNDLEILNLTSRLNYIVGHEITKNNGVVMSSTSANEIVEALKLSSVDELIGQTIKIGNKKEYEIEGIYDNSLAYKWDDFIVSDSELIISSPEKQHIEDYNLNIGYVNNYEQLVINDEQIPCDICEDGVQTRSSVDYEKSTANGVEGLINPNTSIYPEDYADFIVITLDESADVNQVISDIRNIDPTVENLYLTNKTNITSLINTNYTIIGVFQLILIEFIIYILVFVTLYSSFLNKGKIFSRVVQLCVVATLASFISWILFIALPISIWNIETLGVLIVFNLVAILCIGLRLYIKEKLTRNIKE